MNSINQNDDDAICDYVVSDFHVENEYYSDLNGDLMGLTRLELEIADDKAANELKEDNITFDNDGDLVLNKRSNKRTFVFSMKHQLRTKLDDVGLQIWNASLLLCDFMLNNREFFHDKAVVDLGAGLGINSFIAGVLSKKVYCTDLRRIIEIATQNYSLNTEALTDLTEFLFKSTTKTNNLSFKVFDWSVDYEEKSSFRHDSNDLFGLSEQDYDLMSKADVFIASDVVYDEHLTKMFMKTLYDLMSKSNGKQLKRAFIANEKRINFEQALMDICSTSYDYFLKCLDELDDYTDELNHCHFKVRQIKSAKTDQEKIQLNDQDGLLVDLLPKYFKNYKRNDYLFIWQIDCVPIN